ncbi:hypothetical protein PSTG_18274 [Puccinia striiformis f. sp. tritici PST-78]|uniref:Uncharacterized protein n=1 Tax=Puccinia striiformis f. sp. tritici PST-78 TaxID=1165861 RepID=A0A0L0UMX8_9BASI|nr:hypothetical protein PSTG_18274 [Puccinia striiformis f. sp. tritici PST-78]
MMANSSETSYFSFPSYKSHFNSEIQAEQLTPVTPTPFYMALEPLVVYPPRPTQSFSVILTTKPKPTSSRSLLQQAWLPSRNSRAQSTSPQSLLHLAPVPSSLLGLHPLVNPSKAGGDPLKESQISNHYLPTK